MIYAKVENIEEYFPNGSLIFNAVSFALSFDFSRPDGRYEVEEKMYASVVSYETSPAAARRFEAHMKYADVHLVFEGEEKLEVSISQDLKALEEYSSREDVIFLEPPPDIGSLPLKPGYFVVLRPNEVHRPGCDLNGRRRVRKIVMKVHMG
jgi:YhcH/YjgK/YiaL family protein